MIKSKKGAGFFWIMVMVIIGLVFLIAIVIFGPGLVKKAAGEITELVPEAALCDDTDGRAYDVQGTTTGLIEGKQQSITDTCVSGEPYGVPWDRLEEYYCQDSPDIFVEVIDCHTKGFAFCEDGACQMCTDPDDSAYHKARGEFDDYYVKTTAIGLSRQSHKPIEGTDSCTELGYIREYECFNETHLWGPAVPCPEGTACFDGACLPEEKVCIDTDAERGWPAYYGVKGTTSGPKQVDPSTYVTETDHCRAVSGYVDDVVLVEWRCEGNEVTSITISCSTVEGMGYVGCQDGRCVSGEGVGGGPGEGAG